MKLFRKTNTRLFFLIFFFGIIGYNTLLLLGISLGLGESTRVLTIPIRLFIDLMLLLLFLINIKNLQSSPPLFLFILFVCFYLLRLVIDANNGALNGYYLSAFEILLYFLSFAVIPFVFLSVQKLTQKNLNTIFHAIFISGAIFVILAVIYYGKYIGQVGRLTSSTAEDDVLSPLALSYTSTLIISVLVFYLLQHKVSLFKKTVMIVIIGLATIPFFLGASRGAIIALFVPFLIYFYNAAGAKNVFKILLISLIAIIGLIYLDQYLESGLLNRFIGRSGNYTAGAGGGEARNKTWAVSFNQFLNHPFFGDSIKVIGQSNYPHNLILETLQSVGIIGAIPLGIVIVKAWRICFRIFKSHKELVWVAVIFVQAFTQHLFSGSINNASWLWSSTALIFAIDYGLKQNLLMKSSK